MKILVIQQKMIGDVLISSILCSNLRKAYPEARIDYLVNENTVPVLNGNPDIDNIVVFTKQADKNLLGLIRFALQLRKEKYDIVIDAYSKLQSWVITLLSGAKRSISYKKPGRTFIYTDNVPMAEFPETNLGLAIERRLSLLEPLNLPIEKIVIPELYLSEDEKNSATELFQKHHVNENRKTVMISLLGSEEIKTYPLKYMGEIVNFIGENYNVNLLFNYFPKQLAAAQEVYAQCSEQTKSKIYFDLYGNDLRSFMAIMERCDLIFGNDGGAINIAKSLRKPSFIVFSPWIEKKIWSTFEDGKLHASTHLNDFLPEIFNGKTYHDLRKISLEYYQKFEPAFFRSKLKDFLDNHLDG